jgi:hypothetical protein
MSFPLPNCFPWITFLPCLAFYPILPFLYPLQNPVSILAAPISVALLMALCRRGEAHSESGIICTFTIRFLIRLSLSCLIPKPDCHLSA